ncbi:nucleotidyltransferase family protein [Bordetella flabilis]|uniref:nucleotidyltransferase family protein n=1 Tax=Bordetella flabilis TaxID=463014 RepID=UPI0039EFE654
MSIVPISQLRNGFVGVLLAGGRGERFRASAQCADADKLLAVLPDGRYVAAAAAAAMREVLPTVVAVVRPGNAALRGALQDAGCIVLESSAAVRGMGASLAHAAQALARAHADADADADTDADADADAGAHGRADAPPTAPPRGCVVALADMPWVAPATFESVRQAALAHRIAAAAHGGRRGHPVAFAWDLLPELAALDGDEGARSLLRRHGVYEVPCDDPGVLRDVDTVDDLA